MLFRHEMPVLIAACLILLFLIWATMPRAHAEDSGNTDPAELTDVPEVGAMPEAVPELAPQKTTDPAPTAGQLRRAKCAHLWQTVAPWSYSPEIVEFFIGEHERLGIGSEWLASFTYGFANFGLTIGRRAPGLCYGPMDVKWGGSHSRRAGARRPEDLRDWRLNITAHCLEAQEGVRRGHEGLALCRWIMFPARPHDWGGGRFRRTWARCTSIIADWYCSQPPQAGQPEAANPRPEAPAPPALANSAAGEPLVAGEEQSVRRDHRAT